MTNDPGGVVISMREVYAAVMGLTGKVDVVISQQSMGQQVDADHEMRIRALERRRWPLASLTIAVSGLATLLAGLALIR